MADLNKLLDTAQKQGAGAKGTLEKLLLTYETLYREAKSIYRIESIGSTEGLDDFYRLLQITKRNKDVIGSLFRGLKGLRSLDSFHFVEDDDVPEPKKPLTNDGMEELVSMLSKSSTPPTPIAVPETLVKGSN